MISRDVFFQGYRAAFGALKQEQVDGLTALLDGIDGDTRIRNVRDAAYMLATVKHECADTFKPIAEYGKGKGHPYGKPDPTTRQTYYGRGYVQLTWKRNYEVFGSRLDVDLVNEPGIAMRPDVAYQIMSLGMSEGLFTGKKLATYITDEWADYRNCRRIINGLDRADLIAGYAVQFEKILRASNQPVKGTE